MLFILYKMDYFSIMFVFIHNILAAFLCIY